MKSLDVVSSGGDPAASDATGLNLALKRHYAACEGDDEGEYEADDAEKD